MEVAAEGEWERTRVKRRRRSTTVSVGGDISSFDSEGGNQWECESVKETV